MHSEGERILRNFRIFNLSHPNLPLHRFLKIFLKGDHQNMIIYDMIHRFRCRKIMSMHSEFLSEKYLTFMRL
jgi:hypothetical protein